MAFILTFEGGEVMARSRFTVGTRYKRNEEVSIVRELLVDGKLSVENQSFGGLSRTTQDELSKAWARGEIAFEIHGPNTRKPRDIPLITEFTVADFERLPAKWRDEARRRLDLIRPLLGLPPEERTNEYIEKYVEGKKKDKSKGKEDSLPAQPDSTNAPKQRKNGRKKDQRMGQALSRASIRMWMNDFLDSGCDLRSLVPGYHQYKGKGKSRLTAEDEKIINAVLEECKKQPAKRRAKDVRYDVINRVVDEQGKRPQEELPSLSTMYRRIHKEGFTAILRRQRSHLEKHAEDQVFAGPKPTRILERVEIDDTELDFIVVDLVDRLPIGRPTITKAIDAYSGMPYGFYVGFEPASYLTIQACLYHGILPKPDCQKLYGTKHPWPVYGLPETLIVDNGHHYTGNDLDYACEQLGVLLEWMPVKKPWWKARIESSFYSDDRGLIHTLPGTTFSNVLERGDYDSLRHACISLEGFMQLLHIFLLDEYAIDWHEGVGKKGGVPMKLWEESVRSGYIPSLHHSVNDLRYILYPGEMRTVQASGIDLEALRYQSLALAGLRSYLESKEYRDRKKSAGNQDESRKEKVHVKYDPLDLSMLYVYDPRTGHEDWLPVPAVDQEYTKGLSIHKHRVIRNYILRQKKEVDIYELAAAKKHIQEVVEYEYGLTRKVRGRRKAARYLGIGSELMPGAASNVLASPTPQDELMHEEAEKEVEVEGEAKIDAGTEEVANSQAPDDSKSVKKQRKRKKKSSDVPATGLNIPTAQETETASLPKEGWSGDYELP
jgi:putative transposase